MTDTVKNIDIVLEAFGLANDLLDFPRDWHKKFVRNVLIATVIAIFAAYFLKRWDMGIIDVLISLAIMVGGLIIGTQTIPVATIIGWGIASGILKTPETIGEETKKAFKFVYALAGKVLFYLAFIFFLIGTFPIPITFPLFCIILAGGLIIAWGIISWQIPGERFRNAAFAYIGIILAWGILSSGWNYVLYSETGSTVEEIQTTQKSMQTEDDQEALKYLQDKITDNRAKTDEDLRRVLTNGEYTFWKKMEAEKRKSSPIQTSVTEISQDISGLPSGVKKILLYLIATGIIIAAIMIAKRIFRAVSGGATGATALVIATTTAVKGNADAKNAGASVLKVLGIILLLLTIICSVVGVVLTYQQYYEKHGRWEAVGRFDYYPFKYVEGSGNWQNFAIEPGWTYKIRWSGNYEAPEYAQSTSGNQGIYMKTIDSQRGIEDTYYCKITDHVPDQTHKRYALIGRTGNQPIENGVPFTPDSNEASFTINVPQDWSGNCTGKEFLTPADNFIHNRGKITIVVERARQ